MLRDNRCMYMAHVCFYGCCIGCVGVCGNTSWVAAVVKHTRFLVLLYVCVRGVMDVVFSFCIVRRGSECARVWEV